MGSGALLTVQYMYSYIQDSIQYTVCMYDCMYTVASAPAMTGVVFMPRISKSLGQCARLENQ